MSRWKRALVTLALVSISQLGLARDMNRDEQNLFESATAALNKGANTEAVQQLELLADRGVVHPDVSFDRAIAYARRARSPQARPGDLGRAAFALSETLNLRPDDAEAKALLARVDHELRRARSRRGSPSLLARPRLTRAVVDLLPENAWAIAAGLCSLATTLGIFFWFGSARPRRRLAGAVTAWLGGALLLLTCLGLAYAVNERKSTRQGVVVAEDARLLDVTGAPLVPSRHTGQDLSIPEGARVVVTSRTERLFQVEWGSLVAYVSQSEVQLLPPSQ
ncbi:MAG: hypothetical protein ACM3ZE_26930 [Myxococcales bacterium]